MNGDQAMTLRLAALLEHADGEMLLAGASTNRDDAHEHIREARAALQRALEIEREAA